MVDRVYEFERRGLGLLVVGIFVLLVGSCGGGGLQGALSAHVGIENAKQQPPPGPEDIPQLIADLRDDDVRSNALGAQWHLERLGELAVPALEAALDSDDLQQRQCAASVLRKLVEKKVITPSYRLIEVTVEGLADDEIRGTQNVANAYDGRWFLDKHIHEAAGCMQAALYSEDGQQRFLSAYLLAKNGVRERVEDVCRILIPHLADNDTVSDAVLSCYALTQLGKSALPYLRPHENSADRQQRDAVKLIIKDIEKPPATKRELHARKKLQKLTTIVHDPCVQYSEQIIDDLGDYKKERQFYSLWRDKEGPVACLSELQKKHGERLSWKYDHKEPSFLQVAVGMRLKETFERLLTLRVYQDGSVDRRVTEGDAGPRWEFVYRP